MHRVHLLVLYPISFILHSSIEIPLLCTSRLGYTRICLAFVRPCVDILGVFTQEISNDISECMAQYMAHPLPSASAAAQQKHYVTYTAPTTDPYPISVTLLEAPALLASSGTTGFRTWEASLYLASFFVSAEGKRYIKGRNVLELGAGTGFLSILCATHLDARSVLATDGSEEVVNDLRVNMALNRVEGNENVKVNYLQWGQTLIGGVADCRKQGQEYELVIGADVVGQLPRKTVMPLIGTADIRCTIYPSSGRNIERPVRAVPQDQSCHISYCTERTYFSCLSQRLWYVDVTSSGNQIVFDLQQMQMTLQGRNWRLMGRRCRNKSASSIQHQLQSISF